MNLINKCFTNHESLKDEAFFAIHKITLDALTSDSDQKLLQWKNELQRLPKLIQEKLLLSVENMFCPLFVSHLRWSQPNDWMLKYFTLIFHRALNLKKIWLTQWLTRYQTILKQNFLTVYCNFSWNLIIFLMIRIIQLFGVKGMDICLDK